MNRRYRKTVIAGNWKMNMTATETKKFAEELKTNQHIRTGAASGFGIPYLILNFKDCCAIIASGTIAFVRISGTGSESLPVSIKHPYSLALRRTACGITAHVVCSEIPLRTSPYIIVLFQTGKGREVS